MAATSNVTSLSGPFSRDLMMAFPRMMARAGSFAFITVPERIDSMLGFRNGGSMIAEATGNRTWNVASEALSSGPVSRSVVHSAPEATASTENLSKGLNSLSIIQLKNFGGIFSYMTSKWALACFTLVSLRFVLIPFAPSIDDRLIIRRPLFLIERRSTLLPVATSVSAGHCD